MYEEFTGKRLLSYLERIGNQFLYQKTGFLLSKQKEQLGLSDIFLKNARIKLEK